jgi:sugar lactone lactonase YvrE
MELELVADGLAFPEGPIVCADGSVILTEIAAGRLTRVHPDGRKQVLVETGGGPTAQRSARMERSGSATMAAPSPTASRTVCCSPAPPIRIIAADRSSATMSKRGGSRRCTKPAVASG